jgi:O-antigen ligase
MVLAGRMGGAEMNLMRSANHKLSLPFFSGNTLFTKQKIALLIFFLSPFLTPYLIYPRVFSFYAIPAFLLCLSAVLFSVNGVRNKTLLLPSIPFALFLLLIISLTISYISRPFSSPFGNVEVPLLMLVAFIAFFAASQAGHVIKDVYSTYLPAALLWITAALPVWLGWTDGMPLLIDSWALTTDPQLKMNGPFTNGNVLAILIAIAWAISVYYWLKNRHSYSWCFWFLLTFFWVWVVASMSRGAWLAQAFVLMWLVIFLVRSKAYKRLAYLFVAGLIAWTAGSILLSTVQPDASITLQERFSSTQGVGSAPRIVLWNSAFEMWKEHPWFGVGAGRFDAHFLDAQATALAGMEHPKAGLEVAFDSAHNLLLHLMAELGLVGILLWLSITLLLVRNIWRYRYRLRSPQWPALAAASMLWIQGMFNITMTGPFPVLLFALLLGWSFAPMVRKARSDNANGLSLPKAHLAIISISLAALMFIGALSTASAWLNFEKWMYMEANPDKGRVASQFISRDDILPYLIQTSVSEFSSAGNLAAMGNMQPLISQALLVQQHPTLLRQLFFSHAIRGELELACKTGDFIEAQHWASEKNSHLYRAACEGRLSQSLEIQK